MQSSILTKNQIAFLEKIRESDFLIRNFYFTGGTALAEFYLKHRYSEDLDFFSEHEFDGLQINVFLKSAQKDLGITGVDFQQSYNRNLFFLHLKREVLKVEFTFFPFPKAEKGIKKYGIEIDSLLDIAINKLFTIYQRTKARDYIDLYMMCTEKGFSIEELIKKAKLKFDWHIDPLQLGTQFLKAEEAKDYPKMLQEISRKEWQNFFRKEAEKLKTKVLE